MRFALVALSFYCQIVSRACLFDCGFYYNSIRPKKRLSVAEATSFL